MRVDSLVFYVANEIFPIKSVVIYAVIGEM
jgi:hypothetical protein